MTPEGKVRKYLRDQAIANGFEHRKLKWIGRNGAPDEFICKPILCHAFVEVKRLGKEPTNQQGREHERLRRAGFTVEVVDSKESVDLLIQRLTQA